MLKSILFERENLLSNLHLKNVKNACECRKFR